MLSALAFSTWSETLGLLWRERCASTSRQSTSHGRDHPTDHWQTLTSLNNLSSAYIQSWFAVSGHGGCHGGPDAHPWWSHAWGMENCQGIPNKRAARTVKYQAYPSLITMQRSFYSHPCCHSQTVVSLEPHPPCPYSLALLPSAS